MRYLGIDLGTRSCGIAISDKTNVIATPLETIKFKHEDYEFVGNKLNEIIKEKEVTDLIIGLPKNMDGSSGFATKRSEELKKYINDVNIHYIDERLTTVMAKNILRSNGINERNGRKVVDTLAATLILETFLKRLEHEKK